MFVAVAGAGETGAEGVAAPNVKDGAAADAAAGAAEEELPPKLNGEAPPAAGAPAPNEKEGVTAPEPGAGEGGAGDGDADGAPKVNAGGLVGLVDALAAPPKNELVAAAGEGAPNGEAGGLLSFFSVELGAPKVKPPAVEPKSEAAPAAGAALPPDDTPPNEKDGGAGAGAAAGSASSSIPLSPASSVTDAGADGGFSVPKVALGAGSFFSSACGVAGVVPNVNVGVVAAGFAAAAAAGAPKENGAAGLSLSSEAFVAGAPKEKGEAVAGAASALAAPNANGDLRDCDRVENRVFGGQARLDSAANPDH